MNVGDMVEMIDSRYGIPAGERGEVESMEVDLSFMRNSTILVTFNLKYGTVPVRINWLRVVSAVDRLADLS